VSLNRESPVGIVDHFAIGIPRFTKEAAATRQCGCRATTCRGWSRKAGVVFISSESGLHIPTEILHYGTTKCAQVAISRGLAETVALGEDVTCKSPTAAACRVQSSAVSVHSDRLDQLEEGNVAGGHAGEVEAVP
jgi:NAD(P)-dependent dehydrogenase (short-subunit alcohol dehydrogenase family)